MTGEQVRPARAAQWRKVAIGTGQRLAAALCLIGVYEAAVSEFDIRWVTALVFGAFIVATRPPQWTVPETIPQQLRWPSSVILCAGLLPGWLLMSAAAPAEALGTSPRLLIWVWCAGVCWTLLGAWRASPRTRPASSEAGAPAAWVWVLIVLGVALALRVWSIGTVPREVHVDEAFTTGMARAFYADPARDWFGADILMNFFYALAGTGTLVFGLNLGGARAADVVFGTLSVVLLFDALRRVSTRRVAIIGALLLATNHVHIAYSRNAAGYIQSALVVALLLAVAARVWTDPTYFNAVLLGVVAGLGVQTVPASVASLPLLGATLGVLVLLQPARGRALLVPVGIAAVTCASIAAPFAAGMWQHRASLLSRSNSISIFAPHVMASLKAGYHTDSTLEVVARQVWKGLTGFQNGRNAQPQYATTRPMADGYTAALMIPGGIFAVLGLRQFVAATACVFTAGYLIVGLGMYHAMGFQRAVGGLPSGMVLAAIGLVQCGETLLAGRVWVTRWARDLLLAAVVIVCGLVNLHIYFVQCRPTILFSDVDSEASWAAREFARDYHVHIVDSPKPPKELPPLIIADLPVLFNDVGDPVKYVQSVDVTGADLFIVRGDNTAARDALLARFPGARLEVRRRHPAYGPTLFLVFVERPGGQRAGSGDAARSDEKPPGWRQPFDRLSAALSRAVENYVRREYDVGGSMR